MKSQEETLKAFGFLVVISTLMIPLFSAVSYADVIWNESTNGDLSNDGTLPTNLPALGLGNNRIVGSIGIFWCEDYADVASFIVPDGYLLSNLILESYNCGIYYDYVPFSFYEGASTAGELIEFMLLSEAGAGTDLLQFDSKPGPQPAGIYTFKFGSIQSHVAVDERSTYTVNLTLSPVPEPATMMLLSIGGLVVLRRRRNRKLTINTCITKG